MQPPRALSYTGSGVHRRAGCLTLSLALFPGATLRTSDNTKIPLVLYAPGFSAHPSQVLKRSRRKGHGLPTNQRGMVIPTSKVEPPGPRIPATIVPPWTLRERATFSHGGRDARKAGSVGLHAACM